MSGGVNSGANSPRMAIPAMVLLAPGDACLDTSPPASSLRYSLKSIQQGLPTTHQTTTAVSHLESVRHTYTLSGVSERALSQQGGGGDKYGLPVTLDQVD